MTALEALVRRRSPALPGFVGRLAGAGLLQQPLQVSRPPYIQISGKRVLNFTSADYLGLGRHPEVVGAVQRLVEACGVSYGLPRLFFTDNLTARLEAGIARLVSQEKALVFPSTTHIALDVLPLLAGSGGALFLDEWAYPISREGARAAAQQGAELASFPHNDLSYLERLLRARGGVKDKVIVIDGVYPAGGRAAPLPAFLRLAQRYGALIYLDDAHGIGLLGRDPQGCPPYGRGGGGTPAFYASPPGEIVHVGSLSKAFGAPLAFVAGPAPFIDYLHASSKACLHSSPPAIPTMAAALAALRVNAAQGDRLRGQLARAVARFREILAVCGWQAASQPAFPIQSVYFQKPEEALEAAARLRKNGLWASVQLHPPDHPQGGAVRFLLTAAHLHLPRSAFSPLKCPAWATR